MSKALAYLGLSFALIGSFTGANSAGMKFATQDIGGGIFFAFLCLLNLGFTFYWLWRLSK